MPPSPTQHCLDETVVLDLVRGALGPRARAEAEGHLAICADCRQVVSSLASSSFLGITKATERLANEATGGAATYRQTPEELGLAPTAFQVAPIRAAQPGALIGGKYRVDRLLGEGGMGFVVLATHVHLGQKVAVKFMKPDACRTPGAAARFLREAQAAVQMHSEHVARVMDVGTLDDAPPSAKTRGTPFMVMEFLSGTDLAELLRVRGPLPIEDALDYVLQACEAIAEAHRLGIVHRDLKPANLFLTARPDASPLLKVLDFGISKSTGLGDARLALTTDQSVLGSPRYMSPEQMRSTKSVDARTDVWALGCILHELLAGKPAFDADTAPGLAAVVATEPPANLRAQRPDVPPDLEAAILGCLEKDTARRTASVADLARAIASFAPARSQVSVERILRISRGSAPPSGLGYDPTVAAASRGSSAADRPQSTPPQALSAATGQNFARSNAAEDARGPNRLVVALSAVIAAVGVVAVVLFVRASSHTSPPVAASAIPLAPPAAPIAASTAGVPTTAPAPAPPPAADPQAPAPPPPTPAAPVATTPKRSKPPVRPSSTAAAQTADAPGTVAPANGVQPGRALDPNDHGLQDRK